MGRADYLALGSWNVSCSLCGRKRKSFDVIRNWQGMWRCREHDEPRHPQDFVRGVQDVQTVPFAQPPANVFISFCTPETLSAIVGVGGVGCMIVDYISPVYVFAVPTPTPTPPPIPPITGGPVMDEPFFLGGGFIL